MGVERKWLFTLFTVAFLSLTFLLLSSFSIFTTPKPLPSYVHHGSHYPPAFAYFITGGNGDKNRIFRLLLAVYHPRNRYLLHLGMDASDEERQGLAAAVMSVPAIQAFGNADVVGKADYVTHLGSSNVAITLRAAAIMMKLDSGWNWFVTLSARDYPLITQDGSQWVILNRSFLDFCLFGWDNLPRTLLMYFTNVKLSQEGYFHSVICNAPKFKNTTVNGDLRYMIWDNPPKMEPHALNVSVYGQMVESGAAFARQFDADNSVLDMVDKRILHRGHNQVVPGAWCSGRRSWWVDPCSQWGDVNVLKPGPQAKKLEESVSALLDDWNSQTNQCQTSSE
ncbi:hypothetical protein TanjilG_08913 [Lupinus angustifolius]|uniref:Uncharacterized protein n=1 Tax=Lupinus angustifolius TaxID=3871 RepID=A0A4P1RVE5_LUPAN|nr:hypothetical protein TanjilG_08913 [Lupinus angustifolius]